MKSETHGSGTLETWTSAEVAAAQDAQEIVLIDVRTPAEYAFEHVEGAMLLPMSFFDPKHLPGQGDKRIVLMCGSSVRSGKMGKAALDAGAGKIAHLEGGIAAWKAAGLPFVATDMATGAPKRMTKGG